ncbi:hypothetical protein NIES4073_22970 [Kalymmatonema gypsitolerans NIES-4073]|nr:hypothetical protein NIES4073_22970 [Scytonema sp. NIES-4073]
MQGSAVLKAIAPWAVPQAIAIRGSGVREACPLDSANRFLAAKNRERPISPLLSLFPPWLCAASLFQLRLLDSEAC